MRVLVISPALPSPAMAMRGVNTYPPLRLLAARGHHVRAVVPVGRSPRSFLRRSRTRSEVPGIEVDAGVEIRHPRYLTLGPAVKLPGMIRAQRALYWRGLESSVRAFVDGGPGIIHIHSCGLPGALVGRARRAKLVVSMWDDELFDVAPSSARWRRAIADTLRRADAVIYISETLRALGDALVGPHASTVIPLAIDELDDIVPSPADAFTVVTAARLIPRKHVDLLLRAFARFLREAPTARLEILGDGPERGRLGRLASELGILHRVELTGALTHREVRERMAKAHVFVLPSVRESLGTVYFEAMSVRVPVVGVVGEGIAEYVTDGVDGFLMRPGDEDGLVDILRRMFADPDTRLRVGERGRALYDRSGMRWRDHVDAHLHLYERLLSRDG